MEPSPLTTSEIIGISLFFFTMMFGPGIIAIYRNLRRKYLIAIGGLLIGWTAIGGLVMLLIASKGSKLEQIVEKNKKIVMWVGIPLIIIGIIIRIVDYTRTGY